MITPKERRSLDDALDALDLSSHSPLTRASSPSDFTRIPDINLARRIRNKMKPSFGTDGSLRNRSTNGAAISSTIAMDDDSYDYNIADVDPDEVYAALIEDREQICQFIPTLTPLQEQLMEEHFVDILTDFIYGSNLIESAGAGFDVTFKLCQAIFRGHEVPETIREQDSEYLAIEEDLKLNGSHVEKAAIFRSRREIVQHARAACYIIRQVYLEGKDLTEDIILDTHRILTRGVDTEQGISWAEYSGVYRHEEVAAGLTSFLDARLVPSAMRRMIYCMNRDIRKMQRTGQLDPVALAAKYGHIFVNIHLFLDGNGRTCRLILNAILLKYGGNLVAIGVDEQEKEDYLLIAARASQREVSLGRQMDEDSDELAVKNYAELASFILSLYEASMHKLANALSV